MNPDLQRRIQRYGWDKAAIYYENCWKNQLKPAHDLLLDLANIQANDKILDIAAGTGLITFRMSKILGSSGKIIATDISDEMVIIGTNSVESKKIKNVYFERADAENLIFESNTFNLITCSLGLMYFPDPGTSLSEMYRTLKPNGRVVVAVWGSRKKCGWSSIFPIVDARVNTDVCPMFFNLGESEVLKHLLNKSGFREISAVKIETKLSYSSSEEACEASFLGGPVAMAYSRFDEKTKLETKIEYINSIQQFKTKNGYEIPGEFVVCSGVKS